MILTGAPAIKAPPILYGKSEVDSATAAMPTPTETKETTRMTAAS